MEFLASSLCHAPSPFGGMSQGNIEDNLIYIAKEKKKKKRTKSEEIKTKRNKNKL